MRDLSDIKFWKSSGPFVTGPSIHITLQFLCVFKNNKQTKILQTAITHNNVRPNVQRSLSTILAVSKQYKVIQMNAYEPATQNTNRTNLLLKIK